MARKHEQPQKPKYDIGREVYFIENNLVTARPVIGIHAVFDRDLDRCHGKREVPQFTEFRYSFEIGTGVNGYGWVSESRLFSTKEDLLATL